MRQVPEYSNYLLVGGGRLARHLAYYMQGLGLPYSHWTRSENSTKNLYEKLQAHQYTLICISDDQIEPFYQEHKHQGHEFIHFSGSRNFDNITGFHPLMTFGSDLYELGTYESIHWVGSTSEVSFRRVFPGFKNPYSKILPHQKELYHSLCVLSGNGTTLIWDLVQQQFKKLGLPTEAIHPYLNQVSKNIIEQTPGRWTGPWYRKDIKTMERNKLALTPLSLEKLYQEMENLSPNTGAFDENH